MAEANAGTSAGGINPSGPVLPMRVCISDKLNLIEEPEIKSEKGKKTWVFAVIALPLVGICLLLGIFVLATSLTSPAPRHVPEKLLSHPSRKIFIVDINHSNIQSVEKLKNLENCLKQHKFSEVYLIVVNRYINQPINLAKYDNLKAKYPNFHYLVHNPTSFFSGSIFENTLKEGHTLRQLLFKAQLLTLWRYGGIVLSPFWTPLKPLNKRIFENAKGNFIAGFYNDRVGVLACRNTCNAKVFEFMKEMCNTYQLGKSFESDIIDKVTISSKKDIDRLGFPMLCNNMTRNNDCFLMKNNEEVSIMRPKNNATLVEALKERAPEQKRAPVYFRRFFVFP